MSSLLRISEAASLAMHTMVVLSSRPGRRMTTREIATLLVVSEAHLAKVLGRLTRAGFVRSARGPRGGFELDRDPQDVALLAVYEAIEGPLPASKCLLGRAVCNGESCILGQLVKDVNDQVRERLAGAKLSELTEVFTTVE